MKYRVYWQPGCTSCLRTKEFLTSHGIAFDSINVRERPDAMEDLEKFGVRSVPVVATETDFVFAQELREVAEFIGVPVPHAPLVPQDLVEKLDLILAAAQRYLQQLPPDQLATALPGRNRSYLDLGYHLFVIPVAFLDAAQGGELTEAHFERKPPAGIKSADAVAEYGAAVRNSMQDWWRTSGSKELPATVKTYYGEQPGNLVLERTCWHTAQHCRQLMAVLEGLGIEPDGALGPAELDGLPLPERAWDAEVPLDG